MSTSEKSIKTKKSLTTNQWIGLSIIFIMILGLWYLNYKLLIGNSDKDKIGGMFGVSSSIFAGLAFAGVFITMLLQRNALITTQDELAESKATFKIQKFETTFFNMVSLQNEIIKDLQLGEFTGRMVIDSAKKNLFTVLSEENYLEVYSEYPFSDHVFSLVPTAIQEADNLLNDEYFTKYYNSYSNNLNHYFRHLYHIFKFIYFSNLPSKEKNFYATILRAQLSQNELFLIAFNSLIDGYGYNKLTYLMREYDILQNMEWDDVKPKIYQQLLIT